MEVYLCGTDEHSPIPGEDVHGIALGKNGDMVVEVRLDHPTDSFLEVRRFTPPTPSDRFMCGAVDMRRWYAITQAGAIFSAPLGIVGGDPQPPTDQNSPIMQPIDFDVAGLSGKAWHRVGCSQREVVVLSKDGDAYFGTVERTPGESTVSFNVRHRFEGHNIEEIVVGGTTHPAQVELPTAAFAKQFHHDLIQLLRRRSAELELSTSHAQTSTAAPAAPTSGGTVTMLANLPPPMPTPSVQPVSGAPTPSERGLGERGPAAEAVPPTQEVARPMLDLPPSSSSALLLPYRLRSRMPFDSWNTSRVVLLQRGTGHVFERNLGGIVFIPHGLAAELASANEAPTPRPRPSLKKGRRRGRPPGSKGAPKGPPPGSPPSPPKQTRPRGRPRKKAVKRGSPAEEEPTRSPRASELANALAELGSEHPAPLSSHPMVAAPPPANRRVEPEKSPPSGVASDPPEPLFALYRHTDVATICGHADVILSWRNPVDEETQTQVRAVDGPPAAMVGAGAFHSALVSREEGRSLYTWAHPYLVTMSDDPTLTPATLGNRPYAELACSLLDRILAGAAETDLSRRDKVKHEKHPPSFDRGDDGAPAPALPPPPSPSPPPFTTAATTGPRARLVAKPSMAAMRWGQQRLLSGMRCSSFGLMVLLMESATPPTQARPHKPLLPHHRAHSPGREEGSKVERKDREEIQPQPHLPIPPPPLGSLTSPVPNAPLPFPPPTLAPATAMTATGGFLAGLAYPPFTPLQSPYGPPVYLSQPPAGFFQPPFLPAPIAPAPQPQRPLMPYRHHP
ncbi:hypothetical protein PAPYR_902 [Paratrimastix pyriformis]|uniref:Uncharacterized protein n=1 Tax=Paratrimastix pyriformis TaxID=342808 RepID=A0ABQ8UT35_9EUKA|nr:hypothetical protein PAPYR_902 [Paratrimastix pyriformis]